MKTRLLLLVVVICLFSLPTTSSAAPLITKLSVGSVSCFVLNGFAWCWGRNIYGGLGDGTTKDRETAARVITYENKLLTNVTDVSVGSFTTCAVANKQAWCWGRLFNKTYTKAIAINKQGGGILTGVTKISSSNGTVCAIAAGDVWCWGANHGRIGDGTYTPNRSVAVHVRISPTEYLRNATDVTMGYDHACAISDKKIYCWGSMLFSQGGDVASPGSYIANYASLTNVSLVNVTAISAGPWHTCAVDTSQVYCWGKNEYGELGNPSLGLSGVTGHDGPITVYKASNVPLNGVTGLADVGSSSGDDMMCAYLNTQVWCWGNNSEGSLGDGTTMHRSGAVPAMNQSLNPYTRVTLAGASYGKSCAVTNGQLWCWGGRTGPSSLRKPYRVRYSTGAYVP
jgi:alpha-tubulin suppressor-like RCC1 family protein